MSGRTLNNILKASRLFEYRAGIAATLAAELPGIEVVTHPGKIDISDIVEGDSFHAPSIHIAVAEVRKPDHVVSGLRDVPVKVAFYIVTEDIAIDDKLVTRDELGLALGDLISDIAAEPKLSRWGLEDIAYPEDVVFRPLLTSKTFKRGTAYYVVTFSQKLTGRGEHIWSPDEMPPPFLPPELRP
jgi:hypothetical protein